ncbi:hypothetical protein B0H17DRAFT_1231479 [Mycena rosella]|uniref:Nephrocystin-3 n=1 Tax=Mycena rosella TaxID=1033263 RepID=A0AAD7E0L2_MYCRO|nr:hypothetical protein B0H17DRAFT_1231479 [Mycena rosella]
MDSDLWRDQLTCRFQKNREDMKELRADTVDIITVVRDRISAHTDTAAIQFKAQCKELESSWQQWIQTSRWTRQAILQEMHQYFNQNTGNQDIFLLHGLGGAGKTQIALKFMEELVSIFTDIFLIDTSTVTTIETGFKNIVTQRGSEVHWLKSKPDEWLLFFDNAGDPKIDLNNAARDTTDHNKAIAADIVKVAFSFPQVLCYLPLAIIQAGAFISKSGRLDGYLALYATNKTWLLSEKPAQSHDNYAWTIYTIWQISFEQLSEKAKTFPQLCFFLHYQGISEDMFRNAAGYKFGPSSPSKKELQMPRDVLSQFSDPSGVWDPLCFMDVTTVSRTGNITVAGLQYIAVADFRHEYGKAYLFAGHLEKAKQLLMATLEHRSNILGDAHLATLDAMHWGKLKKAEELGMLVVNKRREVLGENHPDTLKSTGNLEFIFTELGRLREAEELNVAVLKTWRHTLGENHPETPLIMLNLSGTYNRLGRLGENHPGTMQKMSNLAFMYHKLGRLQEAEALGIMVFKKYSSILGANYPDTLRTMGTLAMTYSKLGRPQEAETLLVEALKKQTDFLGNNHSSTLRTQSNLGCTFNKLERWQEAEDLLVPALEKLTDFVTANHPYILDTMNSLVVTYTKLGKLKRQSRGCMV